MLVELLNERLQAGDVVLCDEGSQEVSIDGSHHFLSMGDQVFDWISWSWSWGSLGWLWLSWGSRWLGKSCEVTNQLRSDVLSNISQPLWDSSVAEQVLQVKSCRSFTMRLSIVSLIVVGGK